MREDVLTQYPVLLFVESRSAATRALTTIIDEYNISPPPPVIIVDERSDAQILLPLIQRLTTSSSLPVLLIGGELVGPSIDDIKSMDGDGSLKALIGKAGGVVGGGKRKKREAEVISKDFDWTFRT